MSNVHLESINESFVRLNTDLSILRELSTKFSFRVDGYQFMTRYKAGVWDSYIRPINTKNGYCPKGLVPKSHSIPKIMIIRTVLMKGLTVLKKNKFRL